MDRDVANAKIHGNANVKALHRIPFLWIISGMAESPYMSDLEHVLNPLFRKSARAESPRLVLLEALRSPAHLGRKRYRRSVDGEHEQSR